MQTLLEGSQSQAAALQAQLADASLKSERMYQEQEVSFTFWHFYLASTRSAWPGPNSNMHSQACSYSQHKVVQAARFLEPLLRIDVTCCQAVRSWTAVLWPANKAPHRS